MKTAYPLHPHAAAPGAQASRVSGFGLAAEVALLFAMAALAVNGVAASAPAGAPQLSPRVESLAGSRASRVAGPASRSLVVRHSTRITAPNLSLRATTGALAPGVLGAASATIGAAHITYTGLPQLNRGPATGAEGATDQLVRVIRAARVIDLGIAALPAVATQPRSLALAPAAPSADPPAAGATQQDAQQWLPGMAKVISVAALKLGHSADRLPHWNADKMVPVDTALAGIRGTRLAQNQAAPPLHQPRAPVTNSDRLPNQLEVSAGTFVVLLTSSDLSTVAIADPNTADVAVVSSRAVLVNGKAPGVTSLVIVDGARIRQYQIRVTPAIGTRSPDVAAAIGLPGVTVRPLRDALVLEGEVESPEEARRAVEIAGIFTNKVVNQLTVRGAPANDAAIATQIQSAINLPGVTVRSIADTILLEGNVENAAQRQRAETIATRLYKNVLDLIDLPRLTVAQVRDALGAGGIDNSATATTRGLGFTVRQVGDQIILDGMVDSQATIDQAVLTASRTGLQVVNSLQIIPALPAEQVLLNTVETAIGIPGIHATGTTKRIVLTGVAPDTNVAVQAEQVARSYAAEVDNLLQTPHPIAVNVDVSILEINKNDLKNLGATWTNFLDGAANPVGFVLSEPTATGSPGLITDNAGPTSTNPGQFRTRSPLQAAIRAVVDNGNARLLSNPHTTVLSGRTATFQVGGQVPIPGSTTVTNSGSTTSIVFKDFGVLIDIVPVGNVNGVVTMRVRTEVSQPDFTIGVTPPGGGSAIPGFARRSAVTEITVPAGGTVALAGLIEHNVNKLIRKVPVLSKIPILGALFTSKRFQNDQTELAIFVTPTVLPNPLKPGQLAPAAPFASGNTTNAGTVMGNPGIDSFNSGSTFTSPSTKTEGP